MTTVSLNARQADWWQAWRTNEEDEADRQHWLAGLFDSKAVRYFDSVTDLRTNSKDDSIFLRPASRYIKWYWETPDLAVLFNAESMSQNNPLLVLGPYGCICWRGVCEGWSLARIRHEASRIFGIDEVVPFLLRLASMGFVTGDIASLPSLTGESIRKEFQAPAVQFQMIQSFIPWYCLWELCMKCDLRCRICYQPAFVAPGPDEIEAQRLAAQIIESGIFYVCLLGGEALLRGDLEGIVSQLRSGGVFTKIITNGQRLTRERAGSLAKAGLNQVEISFDGLRPESHNASRGEGTFERALNALRHCRDAEIPRGGVVWTMHSGNFDELPILPSFLEQHGVTECYISTFKKTGLNGASAPWEPLTALQLEIIREQIDMWRSVHPHLSIILLPSCSCGRTSVMIGATGGVRTCSFSYHDVGNVTEAPLLDIWRRLEADLPDAGAVGYCSSGNRASACGGS